MRCYLEQQRVDNSRAQPTLEQFSPISYGVNVGRCVCVKSSISRVLKVLMRVKGRSHV